jgi:hypothetical protein
MKILSSVLLLLFLITSMASAEVIDVNIKGMDDGRKTTRQQDYQEAVMNAKLQAIEQAGVSIESITQVVNFQLKYDAVESKSKAILLPGFQIIDIGYVADGTYQVVLIGKIQKEVISSEKPIANQIKNDGRFIAYNNGTVLDTQTNLMWAAKDNGYDIDWLNAKSYCENYGIGGYTDWRMPTADELLRLYSTGKPRPGRCDSSQNNNLTETIDLSCFWIWTSEINDSVGGAALYVDFRGKYCGNYKRSTTMWMRALPVRSAK